MKIALVAMSGVRVRNERLMAVGLTLPGFVERSEVVASLPSLALLTVAALTPERHEVRYLEVADLAGAPDLSGFDLVAISTYTAQAFEAYRLADACRARGQRVVIGGLHATQVPEEAAAHADAVVTGEAEGIWPRLLADLENGRPDKIYRSPGPVDLSLSPLPRYDLLDPARYNRITVQTHRGCPHDCEFCGASKLYGRGYRQKPVAQVMRDIASVRRTWNGSRGPFIELADDNTFVNPAWSAAFLDAMADTGIPWFTETDVSIADHPEILARLFRAGCRQILVGLESATPAGLDGIDARNWKMRRFAGYREAIRRIQDAGVSVNGCFIVGKDADGPEVFDEVAEFVESSDLTEVQVTVQTPFPGTPLYRRLAAEERLLDAAPWDRCTLFDVVYRPKRMTVEQLESGLITLMKRLYRPEASKRRAARRHALLRATVRSGRSTDRAA